MTRETMLKNCRSALGYTLAYEAHTLTASQLKALTETVRALNRAIKR